MIQRNRRREVNPDSEGDSAEAMAEDIIERMPARLPQYPKTLFDLWHKFRTSLTSVYVNQSRSSILWISECGSYKMPQSEGKIYASTFRKFLLTVLDVDYSIDYIQLGFVPNGAKFQTTLKIIVDYFFIGVE